MTEIQFALLEEIAFELREKTLLNACAILNLKPFSFLMRISKPKKTALKISQEIVTRGAVALRNFPSMWRIKNWSNKQQIIFTHKPNLTRNISMQVFQKN